MNIRSAILAGVVAVAMLAPWSDSVKAETVLEEVSRDLAVFLAEAKDREEEWDKKMDALNARMKRYDECAVLLDSNRPGYTSKRAANLDWEYCVR